MRICLLILLFVFNLSTVAWAVHNSDLGYFTVPDDKACAPYVPVITTPLCAGGGCTFFPDQNDLTTGRILVSGQPIPDYSYSPGVYTMKVVIGNDPATQIIDTFTITIYDAAAPAFDYFICTGNRVQLEITDTKYPQYSIDSDGDGDIDLTSPSGMVSPPLQYTSAQAGVPQTVVITGNYVNCNSTTQQITPSDYTPQSPFINRLEVSNSNDIELQLQKDDNYYYELEMSANTSSSMSPKQRVNDETSLTIGGLSPESNYYCFRLGLSDICTSATPTTYSNVICSADLNLAVQDDVIKLNWSTSNSGVSNFSLTKSPGSPISLPASTFSYDDSDIGCGTVYTYQVLNLYGNGSVSVSKAYSGKAISKKTPTPINNITTVVSGKSLQLTWLQDPDFTAESYTVYRVVQGISTELGKTTTPDFTDSEYLTDHFYCYKIEYKDICKKKSPPGTIVCPIELTSELEKNNDVSLSWQEYNGWVTGVDHYEIEKLGSNGTLLMLNAGTATNYVDANDIADPEQVYYYRVFAVSKDGVLLPLPSISDQEAIVKNPIFTNPTAFVPNSSIEANKTFKVYGTFIADYELLIFNRWGELIFRSVDPEIGWDGSQNGHPVPEGTYVFMTHVTDLAGRKFEHGGQVVVLKKS